MHAHTDAPVVIHKKKLLEHLKLYLQKQYINSKYLTIDILTPSLFLQGHDCCPYHFSYKGVGALEFVKKLDIPKQTAKASLSAMQHFQNLDKKSTDEINNELDTLHQNSIT